jgi:hypothetical protein
MIAEVVTDFAVETDGTDAAVDFNWEKKVRPRRDDTARDGGGGVVEKKLWVRRDA